VHSFSRFRLKVLHSRTALWFIGFAQKFRKNEKREKGMTPQEKLYLTPGLLEQIKGHHGIPSDTALAELLGCHRTTLHRIRRHEQTIPMNVALSLHTRFEVPLRQIATTERSCVGAAGKEAPLPDGAAGR